MVLLGALPATAAEYQSNLTQIGVTPTLHQSVTGTGVKVGVLDGYADYDLNPDLTGNHGNVQVIYPGTYNYYDLHATHVSGIIGAAVNNWGVVGVAPGATLYSFPVFDDSGWVANDLGKSALNAAVQNGVRVVNMSYGPTRRGDVFLSGELNLFDDYLNSLVIARAAGNSGTKALNEYYFGDASTALANVLVVGSVNSANQISSFSTRPGSACVGPTSTCAQNDKMMNFFLVAPGESILSDAPGTSLARLSGTSMATPAVAGAAALVIGDGLSKNVPLTPAQVASILKQSAKDLGATGVDSVYGWGLLNVPRALGPVGQTFVATGNTVADGGISTSASTVRRSSVFSAKSFDAAFAGSVYFDEFGRPFDGSRLVVAGDPTGSARSLAALSAGLARHTEGVSGADSTSMAFTSTDNSISTGAVGAVSFSDDNSRFLVGYGEPLSYFQGAGVDMGRLSGGVRLGSQFIDGVGSVNAAFDQSMFASYDRAIDERLSFNAVAFAGLGNNAFTSGSLAPTDSPTANYAAAGLTYRPSDRMWATASFGVMAEDGSVLGAESEGAYGLGSSALSQVASLNLGFALDDRRSVSLYADGVLTDPLGGAGALALASSPLFSARLGVSFAVKDAIVAGDRFSFLVGRPFRTLSGSSTLQVATGREFDGTVDYQTRTIDYGASGLPLEVGFAYQSRWFGLGYGLEARIVDDDIASSNRLDAHFNGALHFNF